MFMSERVAAILAGCEIEHEQISSIGSQNFLVVSCFTRNTPYSKEVERLISSLQKHKIGFCVYSQKDRGEWLQNCRYVPAAILFALMSQEHNVLWVDADAEFRGYPGWFETCEFDVAAHKRLNPGGGFHWNTGTLFYRNSEKVISWLQHQLESVDNFYSGIEGELHDTWWMMKNADKVDINLGAFPAEFSYIFDTKQPEELKVKPVIVHHQASRRLKNG